MRTIKEILSVTNKERMERMERMVKWRDILSDRIALPPDFLGEESGISGIRPSQLTHLGGFRREYLHRKRDSAVPVSEDPNTRSELETNSQTTLMLAAEIEDQMSYMAFLADMDDDRSWSADAFAGRCLARVKASKEEDVSGKSMCEYLQGFHCHWNFICAASNDKCWLGLGNFTHDFLMHHLNNRDIVAGTMSPASQCVLSTFGQEGLWRLWLLSDCRTSCFFSILLLLFILHIHQHHHSEPLCKPSLGGTEHFGNHARGLLLPYTFRVDSSHRQNESGEPHW